MSLTRSVTPVAVAITLLSAGSVRAQAARPTPPAVVPSVRTSVDTPAVASALDALIALARRTNPAVRAAAARVRAAAARVAPAGARPDPMLMAGIQNLPVSSPGFSDFMTMKMIGISQRFPYPGKLALRTRAAADEVTAARDQLAQTELDVTRDVETAYYDLAFADRALAIVRRNAGVLESLVSVSSAQYTAGTGAQADVLRARTEAARLSEEASRLVAQRRATLARLNALLDRPVDTPVPHPVIPAALVRAAVADSTDQIHFTSAALGAAAAGSPLLPVDSLEALAIASSPQLRGRDAMIAAQAARVALARKAHLPDPDVSLTYGQRNGRSDMISAIVSIPIPLQRGRKQAAEAAAANADLLALEADRQTAANTLRADVARRASDLEQARTELALYRRAILPQAQAAFASATAGYQVGRTDFTAVIDAQATVFNYETAYYRSLTTFAKALAALRRIVGAEVLR